MKKKALKKKVKQLEQRVKKLTVRKQIVKHSTPTELLQRIKRQLDEFKQPIRDNGLGWWPIVEDYKRMDPFYLSTMGGAFAGRIPGSK